MVANSIYEWESHARSHSKYSRFVQEVQGARGKRRLQLEERRAVNVSSDATMSEDVELASRTKGLKAISWQRGLGGEAAVKLCSLVFNLTFGKRTFAV